MQTDATCWAQQCCVLLANTVASVCMELYCARWQMLKLHLLSCGHLHYKMHMTAGQAPTVYNSKLLQTVRYYEEFFWFGMLFEPPYKLKTVNLTSISQQGDISGQFPPCKEARLQSWVYQSILNVTIWHNEFEVLSKVRSPEEISGCSSAVWKK